jgi:very-short-patch-repair endonuclease
MIKCHICDKEFDNYIGLSCHISRTHKLSIEQYYIKYIDANNTCKTCGKKLKFYGPKVGYRDGYCKSCVRKTDEFKNNLKQKSIEKYGVEHVFQSNEIKNKIKNTNLNKYGVEVAAKSEEVKTKTKQTNLERYGVEYQAQLKEVQEKMKQTCLNRYGVKCALQYSKVQEKTKQTNLERYGCENSLSSEEIKKKIKLTNISLYGVDNYVKTNKHKTNQKKLFLEELKNGKFPDLEPLFDIDDYKGVNSINKYKFKCKVCGNEFEDHLDNGKKPRCLICFPYEVSMLELEVRNHIQSIYSGHIIFNDRTIIGPKELDILLPDIRLAIEVNGDYYHTEAFGKGDEYHQNKVDLCESIGYRLIFVWEHEWKENQEKVKNMLKEMIT